MAESTEKTLTMVRVCLQNPQVKCVVIDRQPREPVYILAFSEHWNALRARIEKREHLAKQLLTGGPVE